MKVCDFSNFFLRYENCLHEFSALGSQRRANFCELKAQLVYGVSLRTSRATHRNPVLKQQKPKRVYFCRYICTSVCMPLGAHKVQKRELEPLEIVTDGWVLGIRLWCSTRSASALNLGECEVCRRTLHTPVMHSLGRVPDFRVGKLMTYVWMWHLTKMKSDFGAILGSGLGGTFGHLLEL